MMMFHWTSGKRGFNKFTETKAAESEKTLADVSVTMEDKTLKDTASSKPKDETTSRSPKEAQSGDEPPPLPLRPALPPQQTFLPAPRMFTFSSGKKGFKTSQPPPPPTSKDIKSSQERPSSPFDDDTLDLSPRMKMHHMSSGKAGFERLGGACNLPIPEPPPPPKETEPELDSKKRLFQPSLDMVPVLRMMSSSSGKYGFKFTEDETLLQDIPGRDLTSEATTCDQAATAASRPYFTADRGLVMRMLKREQDLRSCEETQRLYDGQDWNQPNVPPSTIEDSIQRQVLREHGVVPSDSNLDLYRCLNGLYENDAEVRQLIVYMKHDISQEGQLRAGHCWPDVTLMTLNKEKVKLSDFYTDKEKPFVIVGASRS